LKNSSVFQPTGIEIDGEQSTVWCVLAEQLAIIDSCEATPVG